MLKEEQQKALKMMCPGNEVSFFVILPTDLKEILSFLSQEHLPSISDIHLLLCGASIYLLSLATLKVRGGHLWNTSNSIVCENVQCLFLSIARSLLTIRVGGQTR